MVGVRSKNILMHLTILKRAVEDHSGKDVEQASILFQYNLILHTIFLKAILQTPPCVSLLYCAWNQGLVSLITPMRLMPSQILVQTDVLIRIFYLSCTVWLPVRKKMT